MKRVGHKKHQNVTRNTQPSTSLLATSVPMYTITYHTDSSAPQTEERYLASATVVRPAILDDPPNLPFLDAPEEVPGAVPAYETTTPCDEKGAKKRQNVAHMDKLKAEEPVFLQILLSLHYHSQLLSACSCGQDSHLRKVACAECLQAELLCPRWWLDKHRTMPTHWALIWNAKDGFFEKRDFCRVMKNTSVALGHYGERVSRQGHGTDIHTVDRQRSAPEFQQLMRAGIFPGSVKDLKTGYTLGLLEYYRQERNQGKGSAYNFVHVLRRMADPFFAGTVPDIYANFLAITRFHQHLDILIQRGHAHGLDVPLPGEVDRPYPNCPIGYLGMQCAVCPERGVNMPMIVSVPKYLRHLISQHMTLDGNFKANLFFKRDDGSDTALTDGNMYFPIQKEFERIAKAYVIPEEDKEVPCKAHIGSIRHQGQGKYGNVVISGVIGSACDHAVLAAFIDMLIG
ncbi:hypothetical protein B0H17DRAFT_1209639 [Mycena rosella]|uniref:CxC2-like cysteine cluster KDZ transposase-associated domain-containing protein n=2 Tax=Mycena rosella TaxID=1033263 RepID=A0AAD7G5J2_MYCRO|nr:hypothetical protein B0H17DRAFT_1209639 [Mycena rosella]